MTMSLADSATIHSGYHSFWICARHNRDDLRALERALNLTAMSGFRAALAWFNIPCPRRRADALIVVAAAAAQIAADGWADPETTARIAANMREER